MLQSVGLQKVRHDRATEQQQRRAVVVGEQAPCAGGWNCTWQLKEHAVTMNLRVMELEPCDAVCQNPSNESIVTEVPGWGGS